MSKDRSTPVPKGNQLSEGLKARLKRCGQYHSSPVDSGKTLKQPCLTLKKSEVQQLDRNKCGLGIVDMVTDTVTKDRSLKAQVLKQQSAAEMSPSGDGILVTVKGELLETNDKGLENVCDNLQGNEYPGSSHYSGQDASYTPEVNRNIKNHDQRHRTPCAPKDNRREHHSTPCVPRNTGRFGKLRCNKLSDSCITIPCIESCEQKSDVCSVEDLIKQKEQLQETLKSKEETLRKLKLVKMYRAKNDLDHLTLVTDKWLDVSQKAIRDLHQLMTEPKPSLTELINHLQIDHSIIKYNSEEEDFMI